MSSRSSEATLHDQHAQAAQVSVWHRLMGLPPVLLRLAVLLSGAAFSAALIVLFPGPVNSLEERVGSLGWTLFSDSNVEERITLVVIDEASIAEIGPWPWSRSDMGRLVEAIDDAGALLQLHDIAYPEPKEGDEEFLAAIQASRGAVVAQIPVLSPQFSGVSKGQLTHPILGLSCERGDSGLSLPQTGHYVAPAESLAGVPKGHNAALIESDGAVRRSPAAVCVEGDAYPALSLTAFLQLGERDSWRGEVAPGAGPLDPAVVLTLPGYPGLEIPLDDTGAMRISFDKAPEAFRAVSAADVLNSRVDLSLLDNAWVIVGGTAFGMSDIVPTPYSGSAFGVELQARLLASILDVDMPFSPQGASWILSLIGLVFAAALYFLAASGGGAVAVGMPIAAVLLPASVAAIHIWALASWNVWLGWFGPALFGLLAASGLLLLEFGRVRLERAAVFGNLNSYLPSDIAREIAFAMPSSSVNARRSDVTLLNADLRNFSAFSEARPPEEIAALLHFFFSRVTEIIEEKGGRVQEFRGDGILAIWDSADRVTARSALTASKMLQASLNDRLLPAEALRGLEPLALGVGIEQGPVLIGSIGPAHRRSYTVLGDTVSVTLRIQEMTAELAQPILLGECIARQLSDSRLESQGSYLLSGLRIPHTLFAPAPPAGCSAPSVKGDQAPNLVVVGGGKS